MKIKNIFIISLMLIVFTAGCSSNSSSPLSPQGKPEQTSGYTSLPVGVTDFENGIPTGGMSPMGLFNLRIDPSRQEADLSSLRQGALKDVLEVVDITNFLQLAPCTDCVKVRSVSLDADGNVIASIGIRHPFDAGDPFKPISGRNRADLHVFNVEGIVVSNLAGTSYPGINETIAGFQLVNADGYTSYLDKILDDIYPTEATIHPYITHFDDYSAGNYDPVNPSGFESVTNPPPSGNLVMAMGCEYDFKDYVFKMDNVNPVDFIFAVGCTYAVSSSSKAMRFNPEYRIPQHNKKAASEVSSLIISNDLTAEDTSSTAEIEIHVVDINHGVAVGDALNEMKANSSVSQIIVDIPGLMNSTLVIDGNTPVSGSGHDPSDPLVFRGTITNTAGAAEGTYPGLIKVIDSYPSGQNESPLLSGMDGIKRVGPLENPLTGLFEITEFCTYQIFSVDVEQIIYIPQLTLVYDNSINPDLPVSMFGKDMDEADERGPCISWEPDGEYFITAAFQHDPFTDPWNGNRYLVHFFTNDLQDFTNCNFTWWGGVGWNGWNKIYTSSRINATYARWVETDGLQDPISLADHTHQEAWGGGWGWMDHCQEIFVSRVTGKFFWLGDHAVNIRYGISNSSDSLPFDLYNQCYNSTIGSGYISETHSMEDDSTGRIYLAFFDGPSMNEIRLARSTDLGVGHSWQINPVYSGSGLASEVRDPGLDIFTDDSIRITFARKNNSSGNYELCFTSSTDGGNSFSTPVVVSTSADPIYDTPVEKFTEASLPGYEFIIATYESGEKVFLNWSSDNGETWQTTPVLVSTEGVVSHDPEFTINGNDHSIHVIFAADDAVTFGDMIIANYHFAMI